MGFFKSLGKIARQAAPFASLIPGVGPLAAAGIGAAGSALEGKGLKGAITGGLSGYGGSKLLSGITGGGGIAGIPASVAKQGGYKAAGVNLLKSKLGIGDSPAAPASPDVVQTDTHYNPDGSIASQIPIPEQGLPDMLKPTSAGTGAGGASGGWLNTGFNWLKNHPDLLLAGGTAVLGAKTHADAQKRQDRALGSLNAEYAGAAPLRDLSMKMLTDQTPDPRVVGLQRLLARSGNPYQVAQ